jgi:hypothetical protein
LELTNGGVLMAGGRLGASKEIEELARGARKQGWSVVVTSGNHIKWSPPPLDKPREKWTEEDQIQQRPAISGLTPVSAAFSKLKSQLRRKGLHTK